MGRIVSVSNAVPPVVETDWKKALSIEKGFSLGVYAQFLKLATCGFPVGPEANVEHSNKTSYAFAFDTVTTLAFEPTEEYIQEAIRAPAVQTWLKQSRALVVSLFLVTGMKLVKGARIKYSTSKNTTAAGNFGIDIPASGLTVGPKGHWISMNDDETELNRESEFVFAFRVKRLKFGRRLKVEDYHKGAFLAVGREQEDDESVSIEEVDGSHIKTAKVVPDMIENGSVYCVPA